MSIGTHSLFQKEYDPRQRKLTLRGRDRLPEEIVSFSRDNPIEILDASGGSISALPQNIGRLEDLKILFLSDNAFTAVPEALGDCQKLMMVAFKFNKISACAEHALPRSLQWLIMTGNQLQKLPASIGNLKHLRKVALVGNRLGTLPEEMSACRDIELLRISVNDFKESPPRWVYQLPRLAWYSDGANPFLAEAIPSRAPAEIIPIDKLVFSGTAPKESPSSQFYRANLETGEPVGAKIFKRGLASDGRAEDDMHAALAAGQHPNLVNIRGILADPANGREGLVVDLLPADFTEVGNVPNFKTIARDSYPEDKNFSLAFIQNVLACVSAAGEHLHARGIQHGDLYAHNIMANAQGQAILGDFGAASFYHGATGIMRERMDVLAFGRLMEDMLDRCAAAPIQLHALKERCLNETMEARPSFSKIRAALGQLAA